MLGSNFLNGCISFYSTASLIKIAFCMFYIYINIHIIIYYVLINGVRILIDCCNLLANCTKFDKDYQFYKNHGSLISFRFHVSNVHNVLKNGAIIIEILKKSKHLTKTQLSTKCTVYFVLYLFSIMSVSIGNVLFYSSSHIQLF